MGNAKADSRRGKEKLSLSEQNSRMEVINSSAIERKNSDRVVWVDIVKGLASILVIAVHAPKPIFVSRLIAPYFLAVFFLVSGYSTRVPFQKGYVKKNIIKNLKLMLAYGIPLIFLTRILVGNLTFPNISNDFIGLVIQSPQVLTKYFDYLWFFACILIAKLIFYVIVRLSKEKDVGILALSLMIGGAGCFYSWAIRVPLPWHVQTACAVQLLYCAGYFLHKYESVFKRFEFAVFGVSTIMFFVTVINLPMDVDLHTMFFSSYPNYIIQTFFGVAFFICCCRRIGHNSVLEYIGKNSAFFYAFHPIAVMVVLELFSGYSKQMEPYFASFFLTAVSTFLLYLSCELYLQIKAGLKQRKSTAKIPAC